MIKCDENYEKWGGYMFFGGQTHFVHDTKWGQGGGSSQIFQNPTKRSWCPEQLNKYKQARIHYIIEHECIL